MKTSRALRHEMFRAACRFVRAVNAGLFLAGLLIGWAGTKAILDVPPLLKDKCPECGQYKVVFFAGDPREGTAIKRIETGGMSYEVSRTETIGEYLERTE